MWELFIVLPKPLPVTFKRVSEGSQKNRTAAEQGRNDWLLWVGSSGSSIHNRREKVCVHISSLPYTQDCSIRNQLLTFNGRGLNQLLLVAESSRAHPLIGLDQPYREHKPTTNDWLPGDSRISPVIHLTALSVSLIQMQVVAQRGLN